MEPIWNQEMRDRALRIATSANGTMADSMRLVALCEAVPLLVADVSALESQLADERAKVGRLIGLLREAREDVQYNCDSEADTDLLCDIDAALAEVTK